MADRFDSGEKVLDLPTHLWLYVFMPLMNLSPLPSAFFYQIILLVWKEEEIATVGKRQGLQ